MNMGTVDRIVRVVLAVVLAVLYFTGQVTGIAAVIIAILTIVLLATSALGFCPVYAPFGFSTKKKVKE
jgi:hypothetical protein